MQVTIPTLAARYGVCPRTILRWKRRGISVHDPEAVAAHVSEDPRQSLRCLTAVAEAIKEKPAPSEK